MAKFSELNKFIIILGKNGKVLILDFEGEFVSCISVTGVFFSTIGITNDKILLGTDRGLIYAYSLSTLQLLNQIPYQMALIPSGMLNKKEQYERLNKEAALLQVGPAVKEI